MTKIIVTHENGDVEEHDFEMEIKTISIGRRSTNDVCIPNLSVSGTHASLALTEDGQGMLEDLGSTNGTYVNGRLVSRQRLSANDDIVMGKVRLKIKLPQARITPAKPEKATELADTLGSVSSLEKSAAGSRKTHEPPAMNLASADKAEKAPLSAEPVAKLQQEADQSGDYSDVLQRSAAVVNADRAASPAVQQRPDTRLAAATQVATHTFVSETDNKLDHELETKTSTGNKYTAVIEIKNGAKSGQVLPIDKPLTTLGRPGIQIAAIMKKPDGYFLMHIESNDNVEPPRLNSTSIGDQPVLLKSGDALNVAGIDVQFMLS